MHLVRSASLPLFKIVTDPGNTQLTAGDVVAATRVTGRFDPLATLKLKALLVRLGHTKLVLGPATLANPVLHTAAANSEKHALGCTICVGVT